MHIRAVCLKSNKSTNMNINTYILLLFIYYLEIIVRKAKQIKFFGYPLETYQVWTQDKYLLGLERIPYHKKHFANDTIGKPVLLLHGLYLSSAIFTLNNSSLSKSVNK